MAIDTAGNVVIADTGNHTIRKIANGKVTTVAGSPGQSGSANGPGSAARFNAPTGIAVDAAGNIYVADKDNHTIRKISVEGVVTTLAGIDGQAGDSDGTGSEARFSQPWGIAWDRKDILYVTDSTGYRVRKVTTAGVASTLLYPAAHNDTQLRGPHGIKLDAAGNLYFTDFQHVPMSQLPPKTPPNNSATIRKYDFSTGLLSTIAGAAYSDGYYDAIGSGAAFRAPRGLTVDAEGNVFVADSGNSLIRKVTPAGVVTTYAGPSAASFTVALNAPADLIASASGDLYVVDTDNHVIRKLSKAGVATVYAGKEGEAGAADVQ
jgi:sugar lactone lactonase YvrE